MTKEEVLQHDKKFRYMLLSRMQSDCEYYLNYGNRNPKRLWAGDEQLAVPSVTLSTEGSAIEFAVSGGMVDGDDGAVNEPMHWVVVVRKNGKEIDRKTLTFEDGKEIATDDLKLYYK